MNPSASYLLDSLSAPSLRYIIPVYQRKYAWDEEQCLQLWEDVLAVGKSDGGSHFTGSVVWVRTGAISGTGNMQALLIDGQQRMTTLSLLLLALADYAKAHDGLAPDGGELDFYWDDIWEKYLLHNKRSKGEDRYKLTLSEEDDGTYHSMVEHLSDPSYPIDESSERIIQNYETMRSRIEGLADPMSVWVGVQRLQIISVSLEPEKDNPQAIFESMNSTGKDLSAADLVRNYVLMGLEPDDQERLYANYWRQIENALSTDAEVFDRFIHDYLTLVNAPAVVNPKDVYPLFKRMCVAQSIDDADEIEALLGEMLGYAKLWACVALGADQDSARHAMLARIALLDITVVNPLLMVFYDARAEGLVDDAGLYELFAITESYLVRRAVCGWATSSLTKFFPSLVARLRNLPEGVPFRGAYIALLQGAAGTARRFPEDDEFEEQLLTRNMYAFRKCLYVLNGLENASHPKNPTNFFDGCYSIEHIMPQNALAHDEWVDVLGGPEEAPATHTAWLHRLGNLTVTAYNSELSDGSFADKKGRMVGGYENDAIALSAEVVTLDRWDADAIDKRNRTLSTKALKAWPKPVYDQELVVQLSEKKRRALPEGVRGEGFAGLFARGAVKEGDRLVHSGVNGTVTADVNAEGKIVLQNGEVFNSPSMAAIRAVALLGGVGNTRNGWKYWSIQQDGSLVQLNALRTSEEDGGNGAASVKDLRRSFWNGFYEYVTDLQDFSDVFGDFSARKENADSWCSIGIGKAKVHLDAYVAFDSGWHRVGVDAYFTDVDYYGTYFDRRKEIDDMLVDLEVEWDDLDCNKKTRKVHADIFPDTVDSDTWPAAYEWLVAALWKFKAAFGG